MNSVPKPRAVRPYFDKLQIWLPVPANDEELAQAKSGCGQGGLFSECKTARFDAKFQQRIELRQPTDAGLHWAAKHHDGLVNRLEVTLDYVFDCEADRDAAFNFFHRHLVRRWHGKKQKIKLVRGDSSRRSRKRSEPQLVEEIEVGETRYDAGRAPNKIVFYQEEFTRVTGELHCLHLEWHLNGVRSLRSAGIHSLADLLQFDHRGFWRKRLLLFEIDAEKLGRLVRNKRNRTRSRTAAFGTYRFGHLFNRDAKFGNLMIRACVTAQELIDRTGATFRVHRALVGIPTGFFDGLPGSAIRLAPGLFTAPRASSRAAPKATSPPKLHAFFTCRLMQPSSRRS
jgi:hypothetical protein